MPRVQSARRAPCSRQRPCHDHPRSQPCICMSLKAAAGAARPPVCAPGLSASLLNEMAREECFDCHPPPRKPRCMPQRGVEGGAARVKVRRAEGSPHAEGPKCPTSPVQQAKAVP